MIIEGARIGEYGTDNPVAGWIEPQGENPQWILWWNRDGSAVLYTKRSKSGAVQGEPITLPAPSRIDSTFRFGESRSREL